MSPIRALKQLNEIFIVLEVRTCQSAASANANRHNTPAFKSVSRQINQKVVNHLFNNGKADLNEATTFFIPQFLG